MSTEERLGRLDPARRAEVGTRLCRQLTEWIGRKVTPGLGCWSEAWQIVEGPSEVFP